MKLRKLFLRAFGPFTGRELDFAASPARLHLVYGPNEAGKSSALRAIGDLRFGIPLRSADNFTHEHAHMLVAGVFEDAGGDTVALARRKKNKDALTPADPATGEPLLQAPVPSAVLQSLTGGVERARYELSFGLDHARLREGGRQLVQGEGELGAALFEASAGLQGVKALLAALQEDAKAYYGPRSAQAVINEAARQLEEQKQLLKKALVRPEAWRERQRVLEAASEQLKALQDETAALRARAALLAELRAVQPLLQQLDQARAATEALGPLPPLPVDAREQRQSAVRQAEAAQRQAAEAEAELQACTEARAALQLAPQLIQHAGAIARLAQDFEAVRRQRAELLQTRVLADAGAEALAAQAARMAGGVTALGVPGVLSAAPTPAERVALDELLDDGARLAQALADAQARVARTEAQLRAAAPADMQAAVSPAVPAALNAALQQARQWSDGPARHAALQREADAAAERLAQALAELGADAAALQAAQPLLAAEITQAEQAMAQRTSQHAGLQKEDLQLRQDLHAQLRRQQQLAAVGEVVTAQTLLAARARRNALWQQIRENKSASADTPLAQSFEDAQAEADRQADLLREGAERAAQAAECALRIAENHAARQAHAEAMAAWEVGHAEAEARWHQQLVAAGLPAMAPAVLRDWQARRADALVLAQQHTQLQREAADLAQAVSAAEAALVAALRAAGEPLPSSTTIASLVQQAQAWLQQQLEASARAEAQAAQQQQWRAERAAAEADADRLAAGVAANTAGQSDWTKRLWLAAASSPAAIKARIAEFAALAEADAMLRQHQATIARLRAFDDALAQDAQALAVLLQEPAPAHIGDFADQLQRRATEATAAAVQATELARRADTASRQLAQARTQLEASAGVLRSLRTAAAVATPEDLVEAEQRAEQGRARLEEVARLMGQLAAASPRPLDALRQDVAALAMTDGGTDAERSRIEASLPALQERTDQALVAQLAARQAFDAIDTSAAAADAREAMESAAARYRAALQPWAQLKLAESLLQEALRRFRERAQGPMVTLASEYFGLITGGRYVRLRVDEAGDKPALQAVNAEGRAIGVEAMSEGTADQLYLALRLAALELQRSPERVMPLVLDDVLMTSDDVRAGQVFRALARFAEGGQVLLFTHHAHLVGVARGALGDGGVGVHFL